MRVILGGMFLLLSACGTQKAIDSVQDMPGKMDNMQKQMDNMKGKLTEALTFEAMLKPEYGKDLSPVPFDLMPFAKQFAENADPANIPELFYIWIKKLNEVTIDANGTPEPVEQFNHRKMQTYMALQAVAGFLPRAKLNQILFKEVVHTGRYQTAVLQLCMLRVQFLRDVLLEADLFSEPFDGVGKVEGAVKYAEELEHIARLPYTEAISIKITGFAEPIGVIEEKLDSSVALQTWRKIKSKSERALANDVSWTGKPDQDEKLRLEREGRMQSSLTLINERISAWEKSAP